MRCGNGNSATLKIREAGEDRDVAVRIFMPANEPEWGWGCRIEIDWPERTIVRKSGGIDAVQALELALKLIGVELYASDYHQSGALMFDKPGAGYGFPVPQNLRDMLIGDNAKYF